ncbi:MAG: META domain-containing protein [Segniliparus sp.]|uniref:META domain-containing protein n=1 Tax=Segniliparus sp. TaxID=2804064 RepID=UPI003F2E1C69
MRHVLFRSLLVGPVAVCAFAGGRAAASPDELPEALYGEWSVASADGPGAEAVQQAPSLRVRFDSDATGFRVAVSGGCNGMGGSGALHGDELGFRPLISTMMACSPPLMAADEFVAKVLEGPARFEMRADALVLRTGERALRLARKPEDGGADAEPA